MFLDELPTSTVNDPEGTTHFCVTTSLIKPPRSASQHNTQDNITHQILISFVLNGIDTVTVCPLLINDRSNPLNTRGGSPALLGKPRYSWLTSFPSTLPVLVTSYDTVITVSNRLAGPPGDVCAGDEITGGADMVAVALPETVDVPFMVPLAWPVPERMPVAFPGAAVGAADLAAVPVCAAEDAATEPDVAIGTGGLAADAAGFGVANEA